MNNKELTDLYDDIKIIPEFLEKLDKYGFEFIESNNNYVMKYKATPENLDDDITNKLIWFDIKGEKDFYENLLIYKLKKLK